MKRLCIYVLLTLTWGCWGIACGPTLKDCQIQSDCGVLAQCRNFRCQPLDSCQTDQDCQTPRRCVQNQCRSPRPGCSTDQDCKNGRICSAGTCKDPQVQPCVADKDCKGNRVCKAGTCTEPTKPKCVSDKDCKDSQVCTAGTCTEPTTSKCASDKDCKGNRVCTAGVCVAPSGTACTTQKDCVAGQLCIQKKCTAPFYPYCVADRDCKTDEKCGTENSGTKNVCYSHARKCKQDSDCTSTQICREGACAEKSKGVCKLHASPLPFVIDVVMGGSTSKTLTLKNTGTEDCHLEKAEARVEGSLYSNLAYKFNPSNAISKIVIKSGKSIAVEFKPIPKAVGTTRFTFMLIGNNRRILLRESIVVHSKKPSATHLSGWNVSYYKRSRMPSSFIGGCFLGNNTFEAVSSRAFEIGSINTIFGNIVRTQNDGKKWDCVNCTSLSNWPRKTHYELLDLNAIGMECNTKRGFIYGHYIDRQSSTAIPMPLFTRTKDQTTWKRSKEGPKSIFGNYTQQKTMHVWGDDWFFGSSFLLVQYGVDPTTGVTDPKNSHLRYAHITGASGPKAIIHFDRGHNTGLVVIGSNKRVQGKLVRQSTILINTNNAVVPPKTPIPAMGQYWKATPAPPCLDCNIRKARILGPNTFLVGGPGRNVQGQKIWGLWRTTNAGASWKLVFSKVSNDLFDVDILQYDANRILAVAGDIASQNSNLNIEGLLLESLDAGKTFKPVSISSIHGTGPSKIPALFSLKRSPDGKVIYALGRATILKWLR